MFDLIVDCWVSECVQTCNWCCVYGLDDLVWGVNCLVWEDRLCFGGLQT